LQHSIARRFACLSINKTLLQLGRWASAVLNSENISDEIVLLSLAHAV